MVIFFVLVFVKNCFLEFSQQKLFLVFNMTVFCCTLLLIYCYYIIIFKSENKINLIFKFKIENAFSFCYLVFNL